MGELATVIDDNFETDLGWTAENLGATSGYWQRGVPVNDPSWDYDPASDSDGSGRCYLTQNEPGNTDVDDGSVRLTSPTIDMSGDDVTISYDYFLRLTDDDGNDRLLVEIDGNNGAGPVGPRLPGTILTAGLSWRHHEIDQATLDGAGVTLTSTMKLRFTTNDADTQSINESGLDAFKVTSFTCSGGDPNEYTLTVSTVGNGSVDIDPNQATYNYGDMVDLTADADPGWTFDHWSGDLTGSTNPDSLMITGNMSVTAYFTQDEYTLTVATIGNGSVDKDPDQTTYHYGDVVDLTADADPGWTFDHWSGDLTGSTNPDLLMFTGNMNVTAYFTQDEYTLTVSTVGNGSVDKDPGPDDVPLWRYRGPDGGRRPGLVVRLLERRPDRLDQSRFAHDHRQHERDGVLRRG